MIDRLMWKFWTPVRWLAMQVWVHEDWPISNWLAKHGAGPYILGLSIGRWPQRAK